MPQAHRTRVRYTRQAAAIVAVMSEMRTFRGARDIYRALNDDDGVVPYMDYSTPTFYDTLTAELQKVAASKDTPAQFLQNLEKDYKKFMDSNH